MDVIAVLERLQSDGYVRLHRVTGNYYQCFCPFHNDGNERKASCGVLLRDEYKNGQMYQEGWWHCFTCGYTGTMPEAITEIFNRRGIHKSGLDWLSEHVPGFEKPTDFDYLVPSDTMDQLSNKFALQQISEMTGNVQEYVTEEELESYRFTVPYMYERKLTDAVIEAYDVGYDGEWIPPGRSKKVPCITFPVRDKQGRTLFFCRRSVKGKLYNYPTGVTKPVFGIDMIPPGTKSVIICESCINALTAVVYGYHAVALMGTGNSYQLRQLKELGVQEFVICMDGDEAGRRATEKLMRNLRQVAIVWAIDMPDGTDLNDCTKEQFDALYSDRR